MTNTATFPFQGATVTLAASSATELLTALSTFGLGTPATIKATPDKVTKGETKPTQAEQPGNAASTPPAAQASAPAADSGSTDGVGEAHPYNYNDVSARVVAMVKKTGLGKDRALALLQEFGVDHANKLKLEQYVSFIDKADELLGSAA